MVNHIAFDIDNYGTTERLMEDVKKVMQVLTNNDYVCTFRYEDAGIYILEFASADPELGDPYPHWIDSEEYRDFLNYKEDMASDNIECEDIACCGDCCNDLSSNKALR